MSDNGTGFSSAGESDVDQLLLNAQLRDELEPYWDEAVHVVDRYRMPTERENDYLASMLQWERAPVLPISRWFDPELELPHPESLSTAEVHDVLETTLELLYQRDVILEQTNHLSDIELYCLLMRDILPAEQKLLPGVEGGLNWHCIDAEDDPETWLRYYASGQERELWQRETGRVVPPMESPPYPRSLPQHR